MLKAAIDKDLKTAMLSGDKQLVEVLRGLKSAILYKEVADDARETGLSDEGIVTVLKKEQKSRKDAIGIYEQAGEHDRAAQEIYQIQVIQKYLPAEMSEDDIKNVINAVISEMGIETLTPQDMGKVIGTIKQREPNADGATVARLVKERIDK